MSIRYGPVVRERILIMMGDIWEHLQKIELICRKSGELCPAHGAISAASEAAGNHLRNGRCLPRQTERPAL